MNYSGACHIDCRLSPLLSCDQTSTSTRFVYSRGLQDLSQRQHFANQPTNHFPACAIHTPPPTTPHLLSSATPTVTTTTKQTLLVRPDRPPERVSQRPTRRETFALSALPHELRLFHHHLYYSASPDYATHSSRSHSFPLIRRSSCQRHTMSSITTVPHPLTAQRSLKSQY